MNYQKEILLKNGTVCVLRNPTAADAAALLQHMIQTSHETENMARYPDEIVMTQESEAEFLAKKQEDPHSVMISAVVDGQIVGNAGLDPIRVLDRYAHRGGFGISVRRDYWGMGVGSALLSAIIESARTMGLEQVELEVVASNIRALILYKKFGFEIIGTRRHAFRYRDGRYENEYLMQLDL